MYTSTGTIKIRSSSVVLEVDPGIVNFYYSLIPKYVERQRQKHYPHITVVRKFEKFNPEWRRFNGLRVDFTYDTFIYEDGDYFFLKAWSPWVYETRVKLGLKGYRFECLHITIGNKKLIEDKHGK